MNAKYFRSSVLLLCVLFFDVTTVLAKDQKPQLLSSNVKLPIDARIIALLEQSEAEPKLNNKILANIEETSDTFNVAEKYLLLIIKANLATTPNRDRKIIDWLLQIKPLEEKIVKSQLNELMFFNAYLMLSNSYAAIGFYQQAFDAKEVYINRYREYFINEKNNRIAMLDEKYETQRKANENELLQNQNKLKKLTLRESETEKYTQQRNIFITVSTAALFFLLLVRQLKISNRLKHLIKIDSLTGLFNRHTLFRYGRKMTEKALQKQTNLSVALIDIDNFKVINDIYGHSVGDEILKVLADLGNETMRSRDIFARIGGEEFVAILPDATLGEAKAIAEHLREKIAAYDLTPLNITHPLSISIGVANIEQVSREFETLLNAADEAMYCAKAKGRNQVVAYQPPSKSVK